MQTQTVNENKSVLETTKEDIDREKQKEKRSGSSRSRSSEARAGKKHKSKHKHKHKNKRSRSKSTQTKNTHRSRDRSHKKKNHDRDREYRDRDRDRGRDRRDRRDNRQRYKPQPQQKLGPNEVPMPLPNEVEMPPLPGERRERKRSRSPLGYYRRNQNNNDGQFWDSFSWVPRMNFLPNVSSSALANTKKMRRLMITNIPYEIGIKEEDLRNLITRFMAQNYLKDEMNNCPVLNLEMNEEDHNVAVELSSVEQTCRVCKLQKIQLFKGVINGIIRLGDSCYGNNIVTQAQTAAQAQAAAFAAINVLENKRTNFSVDNIRNSNSLTSTVIRVENGVTAYMAAQLTKEQWNEYEEDLLEGFSQFGTIVHHWFVTVKEKDICADPGNLFIQYESKEEAEKAMSEMQGRMYDERQVCLYYVPRDLFYQNFRKGVTPPPIKDKK